MFPTSPRMLATADKVRMSVLQETPTSGHNSVADLQGHMYHLCVDSGCNLEDLPGVINDRNGWGERGSRNPVLSVLIYNEDDDYTKSRQSPVVGMHFKPFIRRNNSVAVAKMLDCYIVVSEFELQSRSYVHFRTNTLKRNMKP